MSQAIDRESIRHRPKGWPVMYQIWDHLLFLHWPVAVDQIRPLVPAELEIDTWQGSAWVALTPLLIRGLRLPGLPALPVFSSTIELNVRTYVHYQGVPGVWFFSLDASSSLVVWGARNTYWLPYLQADMQIKKEAEQFHFHSKRVDRRAQVGEFHARWRHTDSLPLAEPDTDLFFWIERYCMYSLKQRSQRRYLYRSRIFHEPWPMCAAVLDEFSTSMFPATGLPEPNQAPVLHALTEPLTVAVWPPQRVH